MPDFILGGAMKAGTTTVWSWLARHPDIGMPVAKEPRFFTGERGLLDGGAPDAPLRSGRYGEGLPWYESLFQACAGKAVIGEASSRYLHAADAAGLIRATLPQVRLIFVLRDPAERLYAHYRHEQRTLPGLPQFPKLVRDRHPRFARYLADSSYGTQLGRFLSVFDRDRMLLLLTEELEADPAAAARRLFTFLGVDVPGDLSGLTARLNPASVSRSRALNRWLTSRPRGHWAGRLPRPVAELASRIRRKLVAANTVPEAPQPLDPALRRELVDLLGPEIALTERLLGRALPRWRAV
jgi:hypothetical protein